MRIVPLLRNARGGYYRITRESVFDVHVNETSQTHFQKVNRARKTRNPTIRIALSARSRLIMSVALTRIARRVNLTAPDYGGAENLTMKDYDVRSSQPGVGGEATGWHCCDKQDPWTVAAKAA
jgi:hypothetical protein